MIPTFVPFNEHDRMTLALDEVNAVTAADWVERRLLEFLDAYLRIDSNSKDVGQDTAIDPVCGMRIVRSTAAATAHYLGHKYYFCAVNCQVKFSRDPLSYVRVKAM
jgi:YHS domain-containing protein